MLDTDTFLTTLYVITDDFCKTHLPCEVRPGPGAALTRSEVITLAVFGQWRQFPSERAFYRYIRHRFLSAFPTLPDRSQWNRLVRHYRDDLARLFLFLTDVLLARECTYEIVDTMGVRTRNIKRRGPGWLPEQANIGTCSRLGWFEGFRQLLAINPIGVITGFGFGSGSAKDQPLAETLFALRAHPNPCLLSAGQPARGSYIADSGFTGAPNAQRWAADYGAWLECVPQAELANPDWQPWRRWLTSLRQIIETVNDRLLNTFGLDSERPHHITGFQARLAAKAALHNFCIWLNIQSGRQPLAFADLVDW
jgi:hypothetical protein